MSEERITAAYLLASGKHGTLYLGSAADLIRRVWEHRDAHGSIFTSKYGVIRLVWYEPFTLIAEARDCEYRMKKWRRDWKVNLIERDNPHWDDLYRVLTGSEWVRPRA